MNSKSLRARELRVKSERLEAGRVAISVADSGLGIEPKNIGRVFDAFFTTKRNGMGMGLAICRSIVEAHGGTLSVSPGTQHGSVFRVVLPLRELAADPQTPPNESAHQGKLRRIGAMTLVRSAARIA